MTRIIAIVVVIVAAVVAYMYSRAGDVEVGRDVEATSTQPADGDATAVGTDIPTDVAEEAEPADPEALDDTPVAEAAEEQVEAELIEGTEAGITEEAAEAEVLDDTAETVPAEEGSADEEPDAGVGAVSTEEETDGAGAEGITAEEGEQEGLAGTLSEEAEAPAGTTLESSPSSTTATGEQALETPEGLDTTNDGAPEAVIPGSDGETAGADAASVGDATTPATGAATTAVGGTTEADTAEPGPATVGAATNGAAVSGAAVDPGPALRSPTDGTTTAATDVDALLDPASLDVPAVIAAIGASDLEPAQQTQLIEALETAQDSPALLPGVLERIRAALTGG